METKPINAIEVDPELLKQPTGNLAFQSVEDFVKQLFLDDDSEEPCVKIKNEVIIYHKSQSDQLIERLKELTN
ncbi:MAG: hypothetical protein J6W26_07460 [Bacteroidales bacterium]|nr:hypothetical protein [Bacteroidales bacterium]